ncbi:uncharacterized protein SCHCODRAFT_02637118 [Schizophyllum commune H4-8]|nr:uncharacterized protein SCHCODRAFT_02637118 [Schizophyllum commune H4-8]KAI5888582.1 hypothetical protein SCHCODRAFT_02637118 [Schizophyllum commune H4-8]
MSSDSRKMFPVDWPAYIPIHSAAEAPDQATAPTSGRPRQTSVTNDAIPSGHARVSSDPVAPTRRVRFAHVDDAEATDCDDLEVFIAEMTRRFDEEAGALESLAQPYSPSPGSTNKKPMCSSDASSDSESGTDDDEKKPDSVKAKAKIYAPFLSLSQDDTPAYDYASTLEDTRVKRRTGVVKENCNPCRWMADRRLKTTDFTVRCDGPWSPSRYPDWASEIAEERERLAAEVLAETFDDLAPRPPMKFDSEVRISRRLRDGSVLLPRSKRRVVVL